MSIIFGLAVILLVVLGVLLWRRQRRLTTIVTCVRCGTKRTTVLDPQPRADRYSPLLHGIKSRSYSFPADISTCRVSGHQWRP